MDLEIMEQVLKEILQQQKEMAEEYDKAELAKQMAEEDELNERIRNNLAKINIETNAK